jgi:hypothetical protein
MRPALIAGALFAILLQAGAAWACDGYQVQARQVAGDTYDPAQLTGQLVRLSFEASQLSEKCAAMGAVIRPRHGAPRIELSRMGDTLTIRAVSNAFSERADSSEIQLAVHAQQSLARDGRIMLDLFQIDAGQFVPAGDYIAGLEWVAEGQAPQPLDVRVRVEPSVRFVGDSVRRLSLGEVSHGGQAQARFFYATNANLRVTVQSQNRGHLHHESGSVYGAIPYDAYLSGKKLDLTSPSLVILPFQRQAMSNEDLRVQVMPQAARYAGTYRDVLTLDFVAY